LEKTGSKRELEGKEKGGVEIKRLRGDFQASLLQGGK